MKKFQIGLLLGIGLLTSLGIGLLTSLIIAGNDERPNIVLILTDDVSVENIKEDFTFQGSVQWEKLDPLRLKVTLKKNTCKPAEIISKVLQFFPVHDIKIAEPSIEEIVGRIYSSGLSPT